MEKTIYIEGFLVSYDKYNRAKLMFIDDYDELKNQSFTKSYMMNKQKNNVGNSPIVDNDTCMIINCKKTQVALNKFYSKNQLSLTDVNTPDTTTRILPYIPINQLLQTKVLCKVSVKKYKFRNNGILVEGWNINLHSMTN